MTKYFIQMYILYVKSILSKPTTGQLLPFQRTHRDRIIGKSTFLALLLHHNTIHLILYFPIFQVTPKMRIGSTSFILFFFTLINMALYSLKTIQASVRLVPINCFSCTLIKNMDVIHWGRAT